MDQLVDFWQSYSHDIVKAVIVVAAGAFLARFGSAIKRAWLAVWDRRLESRYRRALAAKCEFLKTLGLPEHPGSGVRLRDVYVEPRLEISERWSAIELDRVGEADARSRRDPDARPERAPKTETVSVTEALKRHERLVILGEPGLGKSTLLSHLALSFAANEGPAEDLPLKHRLPIHLRLRDVVGSDLKQPIEPLVSACTSLSPRSAKAFVRRSLEARRCLLLLDGLDEVAEPGKRVAVSDWIENLLSAYPGNRCVVASRPMGYWTSPLAGGFRVGRMLGFSTEQIKLCVGKWYGAVSLGWERDPQFEADRLASDLQKDHRLSDLAACPLLLCLMIFVRIRTGQLPNRRVELYEQLANLLLEDWEWQSGGEVKLDAPACRELLSDLALSFHRARVQAVPRREVEDSLAAALTQLGIAVEHRHEYVQYLRERVPFFEEHGGAQTGFRHLSFQEYLAALALEKDDSVVDFLVERRFDPWWREVILLFAGLKDPSDLVQRLLAEREDLFKSSLLLAGMCIAHSASVDGALRAKVTERIEPLYWDADLGTIRNSALKALAALRDEGILERAVQKIQSKNEAVRWSAVEALGNIGGEKALERLILLLKDRDSRVEGNAVFALGNIGGEKALENLIPLLKDEDSSMRRGAAEAVGNIGGESASEALIPLLKDEDSMVWWGAMSALGNIGGEKALESLIRLVKDEGPDVRGLAARTLGNIGGEKALENLIPLLKDKDDFVQGSAVEALGNIGGEKASEHIIPLLKDKNYWVRGLAARALGNIGGEKALENLIPLLKDEHSNLRGSAAEAVGKIGGQKALESLIPLLKDAMGDVRESAAYALGNIGGEKALESLLPLLKDFFTSVRQSAAHALGNIGGQKALESLLPLLKDEYPGVRRSAASALGNIGGEKALESLLLLLKDEDHHVRSSAAEALGNVGGKSASEALIPLLRDEDFGVPRYAAEALKQICAREGLVIYEDGQVERIEGAELGSGTSPS